MPSITNLSSEEDRTHHFRCMLLSLATVFTTLKVIALVKLKMLFLCLCIDQFYFPKPNTSSRLLHTILQPQTMPVAPYQHSHSSENICISEVHCTWFSPLLFFTLLSGRRRMAACQRGLPGPALLLPPA